MLVVDASAILELLKGSLRGQRLLDRYTKPEEFHAPHLLDAEVLAGLRRWTLTAGLEARQADERLAIYQDLSIRRHAHGVFLQRAWELRPNLSAYDALYVAVAEGLGAPLVTADGRLGRAPGHEAAIEVL